ncbi:MAG: FAD-dependent oxidoreductase [Gammaproteobacteria bacterium]|nr:FAD-dependent oxidoreductase [Gammaproteobacteria bacterium]MBU1624183.1 FAD-dependent oxidoreductase [Gammaproteobacteria bacterium]MBU1981911.1 FAD-dependent oxidoreductase [Gammaproteobacteria bacterium]
MNPIVVIGSGLAAYSVIRELRKLDRDLPLMLVTRDDGDYYSKPMLSNAFAQNKDAAGLVLTPAKEMAEQISFTLHSQYEVSAINAEGKRVHTPQGELPYSSLVLALGADPIRIPVQGDAAESVMSVNDIADYARLRQAMQGVKHITIMGGGLIGCEFANDWTAAGYGVSVIDPGPYPLASLMPERAGKQLLEPLAAIGVDWRFGTSVSSVDRAASGYTLTLADGSQLQTGLVLSAVGLRPRIALAQAAGLEVNRGIKVDAYLRSSDPSIYALGDCAEIDGKVQPFVLPIMHAARALAKTLSGCETTVDFPAMPVVIKTPAHPVVVLPVARDAVGEWKELATGDGMKMVFLDVEDRMTGFVLTGQYASERNEMAKQIGQVPAS